jgi:hypothetical protein
MKLILLFTKETHSMHKNIGITLCCLLLTLVSFDPACAFKAALPRTGQTVCYDPVTNAATPCTGTGQDGEKLKGVSWPTPRFTDNLVNGVSNGTVTDNLTGLIWLKNTNCSVSLGGVNNTGTGLTWANAISWSNALSNGSCGLTDASTAGQWRLPNVNELMSLMDVSTYAPCLPAGNPFTSVQSYGYYWTSTTDPSFTTTAFSFIMNQGLMANYNKTDTYFVWPVRGGL